MVAGGVIEVGSFGALTLGFAVAETTGAALIADGWTRATFEAKDVLPPKWDGKYNSGSLWKEATKKPPRFNGKDLGSDPKRPNAEGFEWKGKGPPGSKQGNWHNPSTGGKREINPSFSA